MKPIKMSAETSTKISAQTTGSASGKYYIIYSPLTFTLMDHLGNCTSPLHLLSILTGLNAANISETNYIDYLNFDETKQREGLIEMLGIESYAIIYIANQIASIEPDCRVILCDGKRRTFAEIINEEKTKPAAVFITSMSSNFPTTVAATIALNHGGIPVIIGGIHVSSNQTDVDCYIRDNVPHPELVSVVCGAGDSTVIRTILSDLDSLSLKQVYTGYETMEDGIWGHDNVVTMKPLRMSLLKKIPVIGSLIARHYLVNPITPYLGCPYACRFCSISALPPEQKRFKPRSPEDFVAELEYYQKDGVNAGNRVYFFLPDNLLLGGKTLETILDCIIESRLVINFAAQISIDVALNEQLLKKLRYAGCTHFIIGFESLDMRNLESISKHITKDIKKSGLDVKTFYGKLIRRIQDHGMSVIGAFIFGLPYDYFHSLEDNSAEELISFCLEHHICVQATCLTDLPGSPNFKKSLEEGCFLYGEPGSMDYLMSLSITDLSEGNRPPPPSLRGSTLTTVYMAYEATQRLGTPVNALRNALFMTRRAWKCTTKNGNNSFFKRVYEAFIAFGNQIINSLYKEGYQAVAISRKGVTGTMERLYNNEKDPWVRETFKDTVEKFR